MLKEKEVISYFLAQMPKAQFREHDFFESDAEILPFGKDKLLFTTDEFSCEDLFSEDDPGLLGWNLSVCTMSDILATGGDPLYYGHSVNISKEWDKDFIIEFAKGIARALKKAGAEFIGGDLGVSSYWKYTGICLGTSEKTITRKGAMPGDGIFITGKVGLGNLEAAATLFRKNKTLRKKMDHTAARFNLRIPESKLIRQWAGCCIDTSDGVLNALNTLAEINKLGYCVQDLPYSLEGNKVCELLNLPETLLFMGECGEYELLFTVEGIKEKEFIKKARNQNLQITKIGKFTENPDKILYEEKLKCIFNDFNISARSYKDIQEYLLDLAKYLTYER